MRLAKYEHACLSLEIDGQLLVVDPGGWTTDLPTLSGVVAVVVTHEHADHWTAEQLSRILDANPDARILAPSGVAAAADGFDIETVAPGDTVEIGPFTLEFFGGTHAKIHDSIPLVDNVGVLVNGSLYYPGDSFATPGTAVEVEVLAAPVGAPWLNTSDAMDFVLAVKAARVFPTHDQTLSAKGKGFHDMLLKSAAKTAGGEYLALAAGEAIEV